jgi:drug/metabolite transporter (DMT)-like permease
LTPGATGSSAYRIGLLMAVAGAVAFSGKAIIIKLSYRYGVDAIDVIMLRMLLALPMFLALAWWGGRGKAALTRQDALSIVGLGFCGYYLASFLDFLGLQYVTASLERLILYLNPTFVLLLGWWLFKRRPTRLQWTAMALSYLGVVVVFGHEVSFSGPDASLGTALVLGSAISYAVYLTYSGELVQRLGAYRLTGLASSVACVFCIAQFAVLRSFDSMATWPTPVFSLGLLNAVACTVAPVLLVMLAIERIGSAATAQAGMVGPLSTLAFGVMLLGEPFNAWILVGTALVLSGVALLARGR